MRTSRDGPITDKWIYAFGLGAIVAALFLIKALLAGDTVPLFTDSDDAMHMVTATALADGQPWFDTTSVRENTPFGAPIHFSRLIDAPIAALLLLLRPMLGVAAADWAARLYPLLLIPMLCVLSYALIRRLVPTVHPLIAAAAPLLSPVVLGEFSPGRVDHHNVQMLLTGALTLAAIAGRTSTGWAIAAGVFAALSLAIGAETFHLVALAIVIFALYWIFDPASSGRVARFALSLSATSLTILVATTPPAAYLTPACDAFSFTYVVAVVSASLALLIAISLRNLLDSRLKRLAGLAVLATFAGAVTVLVSPDCLRGPYAAVDPQLAKAFLSTVADAKSAVENFVTDPGLTYITVGIPLLELMLGIFIATRARGEARINWLVLLAFLAVAIAVALVQLRAIRLAAIYGLPVAIWLIEVARQNYLKRGGSPALLLLAASCVPFAGIVQLPLAVAASDALAAPKPGAPNVEAPGGPPEACTLKSAYTALAALAPARVIAPIGLAPRILYYTPHTVVGTGFHRNADGMMDNIAFFGGGEAEARRIATKRDLDYLAICGLFEMPALTGDAADSISAGASYDWLVNLSAPSDPIQIYRIDLPTAPAP